MNESVKFPTCYALTGSVLYRITGQSQLHPGWFNWAMPNGIAGAAVSRVEVVELSDVAGSSRASAAKWSKNVGAAFGRILVIASEEVDALDLEHLDGDVSVLIVPEPGIDMYVSREDLLDLIREPETQLTTGFFSRVFGAIPAPVPSKLPDLELAIGFGLRDWLAATAKKKHPNHLHEEPVRRTLPDISNWGVVDTACPRMTMGTDFHLSDAIELSEGMRLRFGAERFYPLRWLPCSGVLQKKDGELLSVGLLPPGPMAAWEDGTVSSALKLKPSVLGMGWALSSIYSIVAADMLFRNNARAATDDEVIELILGGDDVLKLTISDGLLILDPHRNASRPASLQLEVCRIGVATREIYVIDTIEFVENRVRHEFTELERPLLFVVRAIPENRK
jgi:hypothetical protein